MKLPIRYYRSLLLTSAFTLALGSMPACASLITYEFDGVCSDCAGTGVGLLTLQDYSLGTPLSAANFYSFTYTSNLFSMSIASPAQLSNIMGSLPDTMPGTAFVVLKDTSATPLYFLSNSDGSWCAGTNCTQDTGTASGWASAAPEPSTQLSVAAALLAVALLLIPRARRA
jgi:hypothetical protein